MFTLIENGEVLTLENLGTRSIVLALGKIIKIDRTYVQNLGR